MRRMVVSTLTVGALCLASAAMAADNRPEQKNLRTDTRPAGTTTVAPAMAAQPPAQGSGQGGSLGTNAGAYAPTGPTDAGGNTDPGKRSNK